MKPAFVILVAVRNAERWIERSIRSALSQNSEQFRIFVTDDESTDSTAELAGKILREGLDHLTVNKSRQGPLQNWIEMLDRCCEEEIAVFLDGDDQLAHRGVLKHLTNVYKDPDVWLTYGSYEYDHESRNPDVNIDPRGIARQIPSDNHTRRAGWCSTHLKSFRVKLSRHLKQESIKVDGRFPAAAGDCFLFFPLIEMAGAHHARYIHEILYLYNWSNPSNEAASTPDYARKMYELSLSQPISPLLEAL